MIAVPEGESPMLRFDDLSPYLLLKNGNYLYKVPYEAGRDGWAVLKVYYGDRTWFQYLSKTFGNVVLANQTGFFPRTRRRVELECLKLWADNDFRVFGIYPEVQVEVPGLPEEGWTLFEWAPGLTFVDYFADESVPVDVRLKTWREFVPEWARRHRIAVDKREPRLIHENGDLKHVMILDDQLVYFDFEMVFRSPTRVKEFAAREILSYLKSLGKTLANEELWETFVEETVQAYEDKGQLRYTHQFAYANPNLFLRAARAYDRTFRPRAQKPFSKYSVARRLQKFLPT